MGHSRPKYNSAVSTFCWAVANDEPFTVNDRSTELELLYIDDLVEGMFDLLEGKEQHCEFDGVETVFCKRMVATAAFPCPTRSRWGRLWICCKSSRHSRLRL